MRSSPARELVTNEPTIAGENATNESNADDEIVTNEPTDARGPFMVASPLVEEGEKSHDGIMICNWLNCDTVAIGMIGVGVRKTHIPELLAGQISAA